MAGAGKAGWQGGWGSRGITHLWKWCQRCPWAGCSCVSACEEGCMYHSSVHSPMDWWAACRSRRRSGWGPGAVGAKHNVVSGPAAKDSITPLGMDVPALRQQKISFRFQIQAPQCKDLVRRQTKQALHGGFWAKNQYGQLLVLFQTCLASRSLHPDADGGVTSLSLSAALLHTHLPFGRYLLPLAARDRACILPPTWCCN